MRSPFARRSVNGEPAWRLANEHTAIQLNDEQIDKMLGSGETGPDVIGLIK
jgi:hypothetical protein